MDGIGTYFNRAVVSSQAFSKKFRNMTEKNIQEALIWLSNGLEEVIPDFMSKCFSIEGAIYHLSDKYWIIPSFLDYRRNISIIYDKDDNDATNDYALKVMTNVPNIELKPRSRANIMHNKFLIGLSKNGTPSFLLTGSANFTTDGLCTQANLFHTFKSKELAKVFLTQKQLLERDLSIKETAEESAWSKTINMNGGVQIRSIFSPEPGKTRKSVDTVVESVRKSKKSIIFCLFSPTDKVLRDSIFKEADSGKMMFGLVNSISDRIEDTETTPDAGAIAKVELYHRSKNNKDVYDHSIYPKSSTPEGFWWELSKLPKSGRKFPVYIHHKFVIIDAETSKPIIYTGSANMSNNSIRRNDENLLEIKGSPKLSSIYLAEFIRLYEHYRARVIWNRWKEGKEKNYKLRKNSSWAKEYYDPHSPKYKSRINLSARS